MKMPSVGAVALLVLHSTCCTDALVLQSGATHQGGFHPAGVNSELLQEDPPPRIGQWYPPNPKTTASTIESLKKFVARHEHHASLLLIGDSTMAGIAGDLTNLTEEVHLAAQLVHTANDMPEPIRITDDNSEVPSGGEWSSVKHVGDTLVDAAVKRASEAHRALHSQECSWAGHVETYVFTSGDLKGLVLHSWGFLPDWSKICWKSCMGDAVKAFAPSAVAWNIGLHLTNKRFDEHTCGPEVDRQPPSGENCGNYEELVTMVTRQLLDASRIVVWKTTNSVCEEKQIEYAGDSVLFVDTPWDWNSARKRRLLETKCHNSCDRMKGFVCYDWVMNERTCQRFYDDSLTALTKIREEFADRATDIRVIDTFTPSKECCEHGCAETDDGEHYRGLDRDFLMNLAAVVAE